jgi:hypothetical protein
MRESARTGALSPVQELGWCTFVLLACAQFTIRCVWRGGSFLDLQKYARGLEALPFQTRVLMAWVLEASADNPHVSPLLMRLGAHLPSEMQNPYSVVLLGVNLVALLIAVWAGRATLVCLTADESFSAWASLLLLYMSYFNLIVGYGIYFMPYDIVSLAFFMVAVWLILSRRYVALIPVFAVATLNRETSIFITVSHEDEYRRSGFAIPRSTKISIVLQVLIWVSIRLWVRQRFINNPLPPGTESGLFGLHFLQNLRSLVKPQQWPLLLSTFGFTLPLFFARFKQIGDQALRKATAVTLSLWTALMLLVGVIVEIRIFNELTAFLMPCVALIVWNRWVRPAAAERLKHEPAA